MKKGYRILTSVLIIGILILTGGSAMAAWTSNAGTKYITTNGGNSSLFVTVGTISQPVYKVASGEIMPQYSVITLTLTGGATFSSSANGNLTATSSSGGVLAPYNATSWAGSTSATFRVTTPAGLIADENITFATTGTAINVSNVPSGGNVDLQITMTTPSNVNIVSSSSLKSSAVGAYLFTGQSLLSPSFTTYSTAADVKATSGMYTKFENDAVRSGSQSDSNSTLFLTPNQWAATDTTIPGNSTTAGLSKYKVLITITGDFNGISKITCNSLFTGSDSSGSTTGGTIGQFSINTAKTAAYATNNDMLASNNIGTVGLPVKPEFYIDGTTTQIERSFQTKVETFADGGNYVASTWLGPVKHYSITRNGVFFTSNSIGQYNTIKISDKSGAVPTGGAKVLINAYDAAGTKLAEAAGNVDILVQNNQTIELTGTQLAARFVGTAMKYEVAVASTSAAITNVKKTPEGFGSNVWSTNGGTL